METKPLIVRIKISDRNCFYYYAIGSDMLANQEEKKHTHGQKCQIFTNLFTKKKKSLKLKCIILIGYHPKADYCILYTVMVTGRKYKQTYRSQVDTLS